MIGSTQGTEPHRLLITGAAGNMGGLLRPLLRRENRILRLTDIADIDNVQPGEEAVTADLLNAEAMAKVCQDTQAVLHLGGISTEAPFEHVLQVNVVGTYNLLRGAVSAGVQKVILASSNHAVGFYRRADVPAGADGLPGNLLPRPDTFYGWSKAAIEALSSLYHHRFGLDITVLRIGTCFAEPADARALITWLAPSDAARLVEAALAHQEPGFRLLWAISDNTWRWWSLAEAEAIGYRSEENAERFAADRIAGFGAPDHVTPLDDLVGGAFCTAPLGEPMG